MLQQCQAFNVNQITSTKLWYFCLQVITEATWLVHTRQLFDRSCLIQWFEHGAFPNPLLLCELTASRSLCTV